MHIQVIPSCVSLKPHWLYVVADNQHESDDDHTSQIHAIFYARTSYTKTHTHTNTHNLN